MTEMTWLLIFIDLDLIHWTIFQNIVYIQNCPRFFSFSFSVKIAVNVKKRHLKDHDKYTVGLQVLEDQFSLQVATYFF